MRVILLIIIAWELDKIASNNIFSGNYYLVFILNGEHTKAWVFWTLKNEYISWNIVIQIIKTK